MFRRIAPVFNSSLVERLLANKPGGLFRKCKLIDLGLSISDFNNLRFSYNNLPIDKFYPTCNKYFPTRFRRFSSFDLTFNDTNVIDIVQNTQLSFTQEVPDFRKKTRYFESIEDDVIDSSFIDLLARITSLVNYDNPHNKKYNISVHQVRLLSYPQIQSDNSPEGIHRDGADYIVSALVLNKYNIRNGNSIIYDNDHNELYRCQLEPGEFIFQDDRQLLHDITPIQAIDGFIGYRDILGFDIKTID